MKILLPVLCCLGVICTANLPAQSLSVLHSFVNPAVTPNAPVVQGPDGSLYGTASSGGIDGFGTVFKVQPNGTGFTNLYNFQGGSDGATPDAGLVLSGGVLFGTTTTDGDGGNGTIFSLGTNGAGFNVLWSFSAGDYTDDGTLTNADGADSEAGLIVSGDTLFGTTYAGGIEGNGVVFSLSTNGNGFMARSFSFGTTNADGIWTNADGADPYATLVLSGTNLYGTTYYGGTNGNGTVFKLGTNGAGYTVLKTFTLTDADGLNLDGANPYTGLILFGATLYGTAENGGAGGDGTVFAVTTNGGVFAVLKTFSATDSDTGTNADGANPDGAVVLAGTNLFGTTYYGGYEGNGNVYRVSTNGATKGFANLHNFAGGTDGANPDAALLLLSNTNVLVGTASTGGNWNGGTIFSLSTNGSAYTNFVVFDGTDGLSPVGGLVLSGTNYYGMTFAGGSADNGIIFQISTNGAAFTILKSFSATDPDTGTNTDGANPQGTLVLSGGMLFGTTTAGGSGANGTVFELGTNGSGFKVLWDFSPGGTNDVGTLTNFDGADPEAGLTLAGGTLYGTTYSGGIWGNGVVFSLSTNNGDGFTVRPFSFGSTNDIGLLTNSDGANPEAPLIQAGINLYGATYYGGTNGNGTLFRLGTNIAGYSVLKTFSVTDSDGNNADGANPFAGLLLSGGTLFGTAEQGGTNGNGTIFAIGTNGSGFTALKSFSDTDEDTGTNTDGANPDGSLLLSSNLLFGTTTSGGYLGGGTFFEITTNGRAFANLHNFDYDTEGDSPYSSLIQAGNFLAATTSEGGIYGGGTVFDLNITVISPRLIISGSGASVSLSWPWPSVGFVLEQNTNPTSTNWLNFTGTINDDGVTRNATTNSRAGNLFFRLYHP